MKLTHRMQAAFTAAALLTPALLLGAQQPAKPKHPKPTPRTELFLGYTHIRAMPQLADGNRLVWLNGGSASLAYNVTRSFGLVTDFGGYNATQLRLVGPGANPNRIADAGGTGYTGLFGPRLSLRKFNHFTPFGQVLVGGAYVTAVNLTGCSTAPCTPLPEQGSFALTAGGGLDIGLSRHLAIRAFQAEYLMTRFANTTTAVRSMQNDIRLSSGLVFRFGGHTASPPAENHAPVSICSVDRRMVRGNSDHPVMLNGQAVDADGDVLSFVWTASGGTLASSSSANTEWNTADLQPGDYTAKLHVDDAHGGVSDCGVSITVEAPPAPPTLTCSVAKPTVFTGESVALYSNGTNVDPQSVTWTTTNGRIDTTTSPVMLVTSKHFVGVYTVKAHGSNGRGESADCQVNVEAQLSPEIVVIEKRIALHSLYFPTAEPTELHPEHGLLGSQRATLTALAADFIQYSDAMPESRLVLEGHADPRGTPEYNQKLSERRVDLTKRFLVEHGVPEASISVKAVGEAHNLTDAEVADAIDNNDELSATERVSLHKNMKVIILASNRRVDVTLSPAGQHSTRTFPFNAKDSMTLISAGKPTRDAMHPRHPHNNK